MAFRTSSSSTRSVPVNNNPMTASQSVLLTRVFKPRATDATNVAAIVKQALTRKGRDGQPGTTASVSFDAGSQSVVVTGTIQSAGGVSTGLASSSTVTQQQIGTTLTMVLTVGELPCVEVGGSAVHAAVAHGDERTPRHLRHHAASTMEVFEGDLRLALRHQDERHTHAGRGR